MYHPRFVKDIASMKLNEGWTVTYWSLQVLYWVGCQQVRESVGSCFLCIAVY